MTAIFFLSAGITIWAVIVYFTKALKPPANLWETVLILALVANIVGKYLTKQRAITYRANNDSCFAYLVLQNSWLFFFYSSSKGVGASGLLCESLDSAFAAL